MNAEIHRYCFDLIKKGHIMTLDLSEHIVSIQCGDCGTVAEKVVRSEDLSSPLVKEEDVWVTPRPCIVCIEPTKIEKAVLAAINAYGKTLNEAINNALFGE